MCKRYSDYSEKYEFSYYAPHIIESIIDARKWCSYTSIPVDRRGWTWVFNNKEDRLAFIMRWGDH